MTITKAQFVQRVRDGHLIETVCCLMEESQHCVWQHKHSFRHLVEGSGNLERWVSSRTEIDREKAKKFWRKGMAESGLKVLRHMLHAELLKCELQRWGEWGGRDLGSVRITMLELHELILHNHRDEDWEWGSLSWEEVESAHTSRLHEISRRYHSECRR
ncbi:hypothetical protein BDN72DRAFT_840147 [Pluteus cervinus]|uniref:Uncharacterized protein n=1 Tax=Pluteus cervinus TaxID=181527 RepID=A0ACD3AWE0_9AGAR|nr:hypothetical protein BDN72DRAFT_840147 [Pluteus cervinus]